MNITELREFDLSLVDKDIADNYREFGIEKYVAERPLLAHICRHLGMLIDAVNALNSQVKIGSSDNGYCQCCKSKNNIQGNNDLG